MPLLPDHMATIDAAGEDHPFRMVTAPARQFLNSTFTETPGSRKREVRPTALLHPKDAERLGIAEGDRVRLGNAQGDLVVTAKLAEGQQEGVVVVESVWPNADFEGGVGINLLVSDDRGPAQGRRGVPRHGGLGATGSGGGGAAGGGIAARKLPHPGPSRKVVAGNTGSLPRGRDGPGWRWACCNGKVAPPTPIPAAPPPPPSDARDDRR